MDLRFPWKLLRRTPKPVPWVQRLDGEQRRTLAENLRRIVSCKAELERGINKNAPPP